MKKMMNQNLYFVIKDNQEIIFFTKNNYNSSQENYGNVGQS